jgi:acyl-coenzyme A synthetase/AMP-(fatty) acid ligase
MTTMNRPQFEEWTWEVPEHFNIGVACSDRHLGTPTESATAMIVEDDQLGTGTCTFRELAEATSRFAQLLRNLGVETGERVLIRLPNSLAYPTAFLGAMKRGAISVPTSTLLVAEEVQYLAEDSGAAVLVTHKAMWPSLREKLEDAGSLRHVILSGPGEMPVSDRLALHDLDAELAAIVRWEPPHASRADDPAYLVYTSGTTGHPKGVLHAHRALIGRLPASRYWFDFRDGDRIMHSGKFNWTYVLGSGLMDPLYHGMTVIVHEGKNDAHTWPRLIKKHGCTIFIGVPTIYRQIIQKTDYSKADVPTLRHCMSAGEHLSDEMLLAWRERFGMDVYEAIGMSEISYYISQNKGMPIRPGAAGFPQPGHDVRLLDAEFNEVPQGEEGMIAIRETDPGLFIEYWNLPGETAKVRRNGWFLTGDYARLDEDGYIWFLGRRDDIINTFGFRVSPHEVERVMKTHPQVADCVAIGQDIGRDKTLVAACVILAPGAKVDAEALLAFGEQHLAGYKRPKVVHILEDYPRTKNGKVIRGKLKQMLEARTAESAG